jgi:hypothetical protein
MGERDTTTIMVSRETREKLGEVRPYSTMSFDELISEMAESVELESEI